MTKKIYMLAAYIALFALVSAVTVAGQSRAGAKESLAPTAVFTNSTGISVTGGAANNAVPYPSAIAVSGLSGTIAATPGSVKVTLNNYSHTFSDDMGLVLVGPTGAALLLQNGAGDDPDMLGVTYAFSDTGATQLPDLAAWPAGTYKPTAYYIGDGFPSPGPLIAYGNPGPEGGGTATFASIFGGTAPNGNWNLFVRDFVSGDSGTISGGWTLEITTNAPTAPPQNIVDFNGDGRTDFSVVRNTGGGTAGQMTWFINLNGTATTYASAWGIATDEFVPVDYDGDDKTDIAVWRAGAPTVAAFYILQSQTNTVRIDTFGQTGDDPSVVGDYDGDGKADVAVYRAGAPSTWFYRGSLNNPSGNVTYFLWGQSGDVPAPGDYDGDGKSDFVIQRNNGGGQGVFWMSQTTAGFNLVVFGTPTDAVVPGDYDGDGKTDIATVRNAAGALNWYVRPSSTGVISGTPFAVFGAAADFPIQGDYDGDGRTDAGVWRPSASAGTSAFYALGSTSGFFAVPFGQNGDYPVANYNSH